jgi:5'-3' exonuclease
VSKICNAAQKPSLLIDASIYIFQYYFAMPDNWFSKKNSWPTAAVYGYTCFLIRLLKEQRPERIAACFDESLGSCFRNQIYADYKSSRALPDEALAFQLNACKKITQLLGIKTFASKTFEADDLLGSLYHRSRRSTRPIAVLTRDKDLGQLIIRDQDFLWDYSASSSSKENVGNISKRDKNKDTKSQELNDDDASHLDEGHLGVNNLGVNNLGINNLDYGNKGIKLFAQDINQKFGVQPQQMSDYLALVGDVSDDIPGVPGVGKMTAQKLLTYFGSVESMLDNINELSNLSIRGSSTLINKLVQYEEQINMAKKLATIVVDIPMIASVNDLSLKKPDVKKYQLFCKKMGFSRLASRIDFL